MLQSNWIVAFGALVVLVNVPTISTQLQPAPLPYYEQPSADPLEPGQINFVRQLDPWNRTTENRYHHLRDHDPKVTARFNQPYRQPVWRCDLRLNSCFLKNRVKYSPFKLVQNFENTPQALVLDVGLAARSLHGLTNRPKPIYAYNAARLTSAGYFPAEYVDACLTFSYFWNGVGMKSLKMLQRNEETSCIYSDEFGSGDFRLQHTGQWRDVQLQLDLRYGPAKFVLEFTFDTGEPRDTRLPDYSALGFIAIRDFSIGYGVCGRNEANECDAAAVTREIYSVGGEGRRY